MSGKETAMSGKETAMSGKETALSGTATAPFRKGIGLAILISLLALGLAAMPAYDFYRNHFSNVSYATDADLKRLDRQRKATRASLRELTTSLERSNDRLNSQHSQTTAEIASFKELVEKELAEVKQSIGTVGNYPVLAEVEYLLRHANQRVLMARDPATALDLLTQADKIISEAVGLSAQSSYGLREALARDMAALRATPRVDMQGIYLEIAAIKDQVADLKRNMLEIARGGQAATEAPSASEGVFDKVLNLVDFRRGHTEVRPILPPKEDYYLRQNIRLQLQIAQMAVLTNNQAAYDQSLREAHGWLVDGFDRQQATAASMIKTLEGLKGTQIDVKMPDISASLTQVRQLLKAQSEIEADPT